MRGNIIPYYARNYYTFRSIADPVTPYFMPLWSKPCLECTARYKDNCFIFLLFLLLLKMLLRLLIIQFVLIVNLFEGIEEIKNNDLTGMSGNIIPYYGRNLHSSRSIVDPVTPDLTSLWSNPRLECASR